jgi:hypothetical protein
MSDAPTVSNSHGDITISDLSKMVELSVIQIKSIVSEFNNRFDKLIDVQNIIDAVVELMSIVSKLRSITGSQKKFLVSKLLIYIIQNTNSGKYDELIDSILIAVVPTVIDKLISVENGEIVINKSTKRVCFPMC